VLVSTVELAWRARRGAALGLTGTEGIGLDWGAVIDRKNRIVASGSAEKEQAVEREGFTVLRGRGRLVGPHEIEVDGGRRVTAEHLVIATGSSPARPPIDGIEHGMTSDELLQHRTLPRRLVVIGGGFIGLEFGFAFARAGSRVTVLQAGPAILPGVDAELRDALVKLGTEAGMQFHTGAQVRRIGADRTVAAEIGGAAERFPADVVLVATGRPPNTGGLGLEVAGVALERGAVQMNEYKQSTTAPHVYAAGDVGGSHQHTPVAWYEGRLAAENALQGNRRAVDYRVFPTNIFTLPSLAQVGLTEAEARRQALRVTVSRTPFEYNGAADVRGETEGLVKVVSEEGTGRLLGVHILGAEAEDLIHIAAVAMRGGLTRQDLAAMHYVFPTLGGAVFDVMWE
jgi:pyruvate/2-oxoglutarate dehydrogenase complex dihydrolipoamide dehydrogenase (E3) component